MTEHPMMPQVGMRYTFWEPAGTIDVPGKGEFPQRFASGAFDRSVGKVIPVKYGGQVICQGRVISAEVAEDGSGAEITYEVVSTATIPDRREER